MKTTLRRRCQHGATADVRVPQTRAPRQNSRHAFRTLSPEAEEAAEEAAEAAAEEEELLLGCI